VRCSNDGVISKKGKELPKILDARKTFCLLKEDVHHLLVLL
jgi:hypothetical protein